MPHSSNSRFDYQRSVLGYHGCDEKTGREIILGNREFEASENHYDWLGAGIYFWEHGPDRALEWAENKAERDQKRVEEGTIGPDEAVRDPYAVGAYVNLGQCLDLTDTLYTETLSTFYPVFEQIYKAVEDEGPPKNEKGHPGDDDFIRRKGDCAFLNWFLRLTDQFGGIPEEVSDLDGEDIKEALDSEPDQTYFETVRGLFTEGDQIYEGSGITEKGHIQISVREPSCILGVFRPHFEGSS